MPASPPPEIPLELVQLSAQAEGGETPLHLQIQRALRQAIEDHFHDGQTFWPELVLMERLGVSRNTLRQALGELVREGLLLQESTKSRVVSKAVTEVGIFLQIYNSDFRAELLHHAARVSQEEKACQFRIFYTAQLDKAIDEFFRLGVSPHKIRVLLFDGARNNRIIQNAIGPRGYKTVMIDTCPQGYTGPFVGTDAAEAARMGVQHLVNLGHRRITLLINEPAQEETVQAKIEAFQHLVARGTIPQGKVHICATESGGNSFELAYNAMDSLWASPERPTAIFTASDPGAWGVLKWLGERQISVPAQISVLGFEGANPSRFTLPALSTVAHPVRALAQRAVQMLFEPNAKPEFLAPTLMVRDSTGRVPSS